MINRNNYVNIKMMAGQTDVCKCKLMFSFKAASILPLLFFGCYQRIVIGQLTLSPMSVAPVCHVGDPLHLTCNASVEFIRWNILQPNEQGILEQAANVQINARDISVQMSERELNSATLTFMRTSFQFGSPLVSTLYIDSISIGWNGTVVNCSDVSNPMTSSSTTIQIIDTNQISIQYTPVLSISEEYQANNVTVTVMWAPAELMDNITFSTEVSPLVPIISIGSTSRQLIISYNTEYNRSVIAVTPCGNAIASVTLNYANCGFPDLLSTIGNDSAMSNESDSSFSAVPTISTECSDSIQIEGCTITFSCPPGLGLTGPNSATCTGNGEWEPDPSWKACKESDSKGALSQIGIIVVAASSIASIFIFASILLLIGCFWRRFSKKRKRLIDRLPPSVTYRKQPPHYDVVQFPPKQELPLKPNESYHSR